ncbi:DUF6221 family protein [Streptomyces antibioticus]|uniref:DUF6221 family protein n=1 Tax=Streptomyces antibioticus TaxID=1890 RepID=UPI0036BC68AE
MSSDLVNFMTVQLEEDERIAWAAPFGPWSLTGSGSIVDAGGSHVICSVGGTLDGRVSCWPERPAIEYLLAHDPTRAVAELAAKRQNLAELAAAEVKMDQAARDRDTARYNTVRAEWTVLRRVVRRDAFAYADRPGYREEWRPDARPTT